MEQYISEGEVDAGILSEMAGKLIPLYGLSRDPGKGCESFSPFASGLGYGSAKGYKYDIPKAGSAGRKEKKKFSLKEFLKETAAGGITGGVASAGFYGAGKGIERLKDSFRNLDRNSNDWYSPLSLNLGEADDASINAAMKIACPSTAEEFKVFGHGNPNGIQYKGQVLNADKVAHLIRNSPQYVGGD